MSDNYTVTKTAKVDGMRIRVYRYTDGTISGWNAYEGRTATQAEIDAALDA